MNKLVGLIAKEIIVGVGINVLATKLIPRLADKAKAKLAQWKTERDVESDETSSDLDADDVVSASREQRKAPQKEVYVYNAQWK